MTTAASLRFMVASSFLGFRERLWLLIALSADEIQLHIAVDIRPDDAVHIAMDLTANQTVHPDMSGAADPGQAGFRHGEGGLVHNLAADEQNLRQYEHNQNHGDDGAPTKALTDAHNGGMGGHHANEDARAVLPNACCTKLYVTINARSLIEMSHLRLCTRAQSEIRSMFQLIKSQVATVCPELAAWMVPSCEANPKYPFCPEGNRCCGRHPKLADVYKTVEK